MRFARSGECGRSAVWCGWGSAADSVPQGDSAMQIRAFARGAWCLHGDVLVRAQVRGAGGLGLVHVTAVPAHERPFVAAVGLRSCRCARPFRALRHPDRVCSPGEVYVPAPRASPWYFSRCASCVSPVLPCSVPLNLHTMSQLLQNHGVAASLGLPCGVAWRGGAMLRLGSFRVGFLVFPSETNRSKGGTK